MHAFYFVIKSSHSKDLAFFAPEIEHNSLPSHTLTALKLKTYKYEFIFGSKKYTLKRVPTEYNNFSNFDF